MKKTIKLIPAIVMLLVSAILVSTSTYAWFSMNSKVTVTGMIIRTEVGDNLLIADDTLASTARQDDANFSNSLVQYQDALVEPVSTVNGTSFFYTANNNVKGSGDAINDVYVAYTPADTSDFNTNYATTGAVGYVDYVFQLKAINGAAASEIRLRQLALTYGGTADAGKAYRVAMFVEDITSAAPAGGVGTLTTIFTESGAANFTTGNAVKTTSTLDTVTYCANDTTAKIDVPANTTKYFKVVIRLWLEGEDTTCNNTTYMALKDKWSLDLKFELKAATNTTEKCVQYITKNVTAAKADLSSASLDSATVTINGVTYTKIATVQLAGNDLYVAGTTLTSSSHVFTIENNTWPTEVTNQCTLPTT